MYYKYPKTWHHPQSKINPHGNDRVLSTLEHFIDKDVVVSIKMDGENTSCYRDKLHARSIDSGFHPSRTWMKAYHATFCNKIPDNWRLCGENVYAKHAIKYENLPTYFFVFGIYDDKNICLSWQDTLLMCKELGLMTVPTFYHGIWDEEKIINACPKRTMIDGVDCGDLEGYVVRISGGFNYDDFPNNCYKFVRPNHVQPGNDHWSKYCIPNTLKKK